LLFLQAEAMGQARSPILDASVSPLPPDAQVIGDASLDAKLTIQVMLKYQSWEELNAILASGKQLTTTEHRTRYWPSKSHYDAVYTWLRRAGLDAQYRYDRSTGIQATGTVAQLSAALGTSFSRVAFRGKEYVVAVSPVVLPVDVEPYVLFVAGLQPLGRKLNAREVGTNR
jgi:hypothetical protein